jgi:hypothetical protein
MSFNKRFSYVKDRHRQIPEKRKKEKELWEVILIG